MALKVGDEVRYVPATFVEPNNTNNLGINAKRLQFNNNQQDLVQAFKTYAPKVQSIDADNTVTLRVDMPIEKNKRAFTLLNKPFKQENLVKIGNSVTRSNPYRPRIIKSISGSNITLQRTTPGRFNKTYSVSNLRKSNSRFTLNHINVSPLSSVITDFQDKDEYPITKGEIVYLLTDQNVSNIGKMNNTKNSTLNRNQVYKVTAINPISKNTIRIVLENNNNTKNIDITRDSSETPFQIDRISKKWIRWNKKTRNSKKNQLYSPPLSTTNLPVGQTISIPVNTQEEEINQVTSPTLMGRNRDIPPTEREIEKREIENNRVTSPTLMGRNRVLSVNSVLSGGSRRRAKKAQNKTKRKGKLRI